MKIESGRKISFKMDLLLTLTPSSLLSGIENHLAWLEHKWIIEEIPKVFLSEHRDMKAYILSLFLEDAQEKKSSGNEYGEDLAEQQTKATSSFGMLAHKFNEVAMNAYVGGFKEAKAHLSDVYLRLEELSHSLSTSRIMALCYIADSMEMCIEQLETVRNSQELQPQQNWKLKYKEIWETIKGDHQAHAVIMFLKASLGAALKLPFEKVLRFFQKSQHLDADYYVWHHYTYRALRRIRRDARRQQKSPCFVSPCDAERAACDTAYRLAPNNVDCLADKALFIKESLWKESETGWNSRQTEHLQCIELFK